MWIGGPEIPEPMHVVRGIGQGQIRKLGRVEVHACSWLNDSRSVLHRVAALARLVICRRNGCRVSSALTASGCVLCLDAVLTAPALRVLARDADATETPRHQSRDRPLGPDIYLHESSVAGHVDQLVSLVQQCKERHGRFISEDIRIREPSSPQKDHVDRLSGLVLESQDVDSGWNGIYGIC